ncbi:hypothetical protein PIB30_027251 [Stylosanthes scabra]|uniref:DUF4283 domain-containing protein n=1 Tax=Stylosanthes scabra TaxID=79078 RepID=A0ABU6V8Y6_9FABA|nr:hypothetical protein [Stylosanthes scabra]
MENEIAEDGVVLHVDPMLNQEHNMNNLNLVGKIIIMKEFSFGSIKAGLMGMWKILMELSSQSFNDHEKGRQILNKDTWSLRGHLINLSLWTALQLIDATKPRYFSGLGVNRSPPIEEMEAPKTHIQIEAWKNEVLRYN